MASNSSEAFEKVKHLFGVERLKTEQLSILTSIIGGEDLFMGFIFITPRHFIMLSCSDNITSSTYRLR
jgi:hypothetical protein